MHHRGAFLSISFLIKTAIIGASGYSGAELLRLLSLRDDVSVNKVTAGSSVGKRVDELYPAFSGSVDLAFEPLSADRFDDIDVAFLALPSGEAMNLVPQLVNSVERIIDLSGDFRLRSASLYEQFYRHTHAAPSLLREAVYGLPELHKGDIATAKLIANPGCYPTSAILALLPVLKHRVIVPEGIVINSLSGVSGAGRTASLELSFTEVNENIRAYNIGTHQHIPEIQSVLEKATGQSIGFSFVPHLVPLNRGIYTTISARLQTELTESELFEIYQMFYQHAPFVRVKKEIPQIKNVVYTNYCDIGFTIERRTNQLILISVIDNLIKGAAGQAVQNMNIMFGLSEEKGLLYHNKEGRDGQ